MRLASGQVSGDQNGALDPKSHMSNKKVSQNLLPSRSELPEVLYCIGVISNKVVSQKLLPSGSEQQEVLYCMGVLRKEYFRLIIR